MEKMVSLVLIAAMTLAMSVNAFAAEPDVLAIIEENKEEIEEAYQNIIDYSTFDVENNRWVLDYSIVTDGIFTEQQYVEAEKAGEAWMEVEKKYGLSGNSNQRALPALLVVAIKAVGAIVGTVVVEQITSYFVTWGVSAGCKKFKKYAPIKSFCKANGFI